MRTRRRLAGRFAEQRFRALHAAWRRRLRPLLASIAVTGIACGVLGLVVGGGWPWAFGLVAGFLIASYSWIVENPPARIQNWRWGSEGERRTERRLRVLDPAAWKVWHDIGRGDATNIDHVVVGPCGIFVLDTKDRTGILSVDEAGLHIQWREDPTVTYLEEGVTKAVRFAGYELHSLLESSVGLKTYVQAVIVLWGEFVQREAHAGDVWFVHGDELAYWLQHQPPRRVDLALAARFFDDAKERGLPGRSASGRL